MNSLTVPEFFLLTISSLLLLVAFDSTRVAVGDWLVARHSFDLSRQMAAEIHVALHSSLLLVAVIFIWVAVRMAVMPNVAITTVAPELMVPTAVWLSIVAGILLVMELAVRWKRWQLLQREAEEDGT